MTDSSLGLAKLDNARLIGVLAKTLRQTDEVVACALEDLNSE